MRKRMLNLLINPVIKLRPLHSYIKQQPAVRSWLLFSYTFNNVSAVQLILNECPFGPQKAGMLHGRIK